MVRIFDEEIAVNASIYTIGGLSAHADRDELLDWIGRFKKRPRRVFVTHGEENAALDFAKAIQDRLQFDAYVPDILEEIHL